MHQGAAASMKVREHNWSKTVVMGMLERGGHGQNRLSIPERRKVIVDKIVRENVLHPAREFTPTNSAVTWHLSNEYYA